MDLTWEVWLGCADECLIPLGYCLSAFSSPPYSEELGGFFWGALMMGGQLYIFLSQDSLLALLVVQGA